MPTDDDVERGIVRLFEAEWESLMDRRRAAQTNEDEGWRERRTDTELRFDSMAECHANHIADRQTRVTDRQRNNLNNGGRWERRLRDSVHRTIGGWAAGSCNQGLRFGSCGEQWLRRQPQDARAALEQ